MKSIKHLLELIMVAAKSIVNSIFSLLSLIQTEQEIPSIVRPFYINRRYFQALGKITSKFVALPMDSGQYGVCKINHVEYYQDFGETCTMANYKFTGRYVSSVIINKGNIDHEHEFKCRS